MFRCFAKRHRKGEPKVIQNEVKIELWAFRDLIFGILGGFARGLIFDEFLIGLKIRKNQENRGGGAERESRPVSAARVGGRGGVPGEALESAKVGRNRQSLQKHPERPVPCEQGAADLKATASAADPYTLRGMVVILWILRSSETCGLVASVWM